jgi:hypothetical protein
MRFLSGLVVLRVNYCLEIIIVPTMRGRGGGGIRRKYTPFMTVEDAEDGAARQVKQLHSSVVAPGNEQAAVRLEIRASRGVSKSCQRPPDGARVRVDDGDGRARGGGYVVRCQRREGEVSDSGGVR